jgi:hypothetical protein
MTISDAALARRNARLNAKAMDRANKLIANEYAELGQAPVSAGANMLVSPELAALLAGEAAE